MTPWAPHKPCAEAKCGTLVPAATRHCAAHARAYRQRRNTERGGSGWAWQQIRAGIIARDGGCVLPPPHAGALQVDHIMPLHRGGTNTPANLRTLCEQHHVAITNQQARERAKR